MKTRIEVIKHSLYKIIYQANTPAGKLFDLVLIVSILVSVLAIILDSVAEINQHYGKLFFLIDWFFTFLFSLEYLLRIFCIHKPWKYIFSFFGLIDLMSIVPSYASLLFPGSHYLQVIRILRVLRIFRVLKLAQYTHQSRQLLNALSASKPKIAIFLFAISTLLVIFGATMYILEGPENGFTNIPVSIYWAVVTLTTVGFGDITPKTDIGRAISAVVMIIGYAIIAVPTGIITTEMTKGMTGQSTETDGRNCPRCRKTGHRSEANYCDRCGTLL